MFFNSPNKLLRPITIQITLNKFVHPSCVPNTSAGKKKLYDKPDCKTVIITGGTGAIGLATANRLLCANAAKIALIDNDICKGKDAVLSLNCSFGKDRAFFVKSDITKKDDIQDALKKVKFEFKKVDLIVNAAGIWDESNWEGEIETNLIGTLNVNQVAKDILEKPGCVLNLAGVPGIDAFSPSPVLSASFHGIVGYSRGMGHEQNSAHTGIRIVVLCCGITQTKFVKDVEKKTSCAEMGKNLQKYLKEECWQKPEVVAKSTIELIKYGPSGSVWVIEGSRLFSLKIPDYHCYRVLETQFT